ncbi:MAG: hypothetical protein ACREX3_15265 [Gammaproteobacteria bacterium]
MTDAVKPLRADSDEGSVRRWRGRVGVLLVLPLVLCLMAFEARWPKDSETRFQVAYERAYRGKLRQLNRRARIRACLRFVHAYFIAVFGP